MAIGDPNLQIVSNKVVPAADNILHQFANYTYKISLLSFKTMQAYNDMLEHANWQKMHKLVPNICYTLMSSGGIPTIASDFLPAKHPKFEVDFYIDSFTTNGFMGQNASTRATNLLQASMAVTEPIGTTLLERLYSVLTEDGPAWAEKPLLIQIDFLGYDEAGTPTRIAPATRWIPTRLLTLDFGLSGEGTNYNLSFVSWATNDQDNNPLSNSLNLKQLKGQKIGDFTKFLETEFNRDQIERSTDQNVPQLGLSSPAAQEFPDEIEFRLDPRISDAKVTPNIAKQTRLKEKPHESPIQERGRGNTPPNLKFKHNAGIRYYGDDGDSKIEVVKPGQSLLSLLEKLIRDSTYITDQLKEDISIDELNKVTSTGGPKKKEILKDPNSGLDWWKITYIKQLKEYDNRRNKYARKLIIQIDPYKVTDPEVTGGTSKPGDNGTRPVARSYEYIYSGNNLDIINLDLSFNNAYKQAMTGVGTSNDSQEDPKIDNTAKVSPDSGSQQDGHSAISGTSELTPANNRFLGDASPTGQQRTAGTLMENLYRKVGSDMMRINIEIVGDPGYIHQDGILTMATPNKAAKHHPGAATDPANGAILGDLDDAHFYLLFKTPRDYNEATGLADFSSSEGGSTLSGYFRVWEITNNFQGGEFTQTLNATRIYEQFRENIDNPEKPGKELMSDDERTSFDFEDVRAAANTLIAPGSTSAVGIDAFGGIGDPVGAPPPSRERFVDADLATRSTALEAEIASELSQREHANEFGSLTGATETGQERNFVNPHQDSNTQTFQTTDISAAEFRAAESRRFGITTSVAENTVAAEVVSSGAGPDNLDIHPEETGGLNKNIIITAPEPADPRFSLPLVPGTPEIEPTGPGEGDIYWNKPRVIDNGGEVLPPPSGSPHGVAALETTPNTSSYSATDQAELNANNAEIERQRQIIIAGASSAAVLAAWKAANALSERNKVIHGKNGIGYNSWKELGLYPNALALPVDPLTGN